MAYGFRCAIFSRSSFHFLKLILFSFNLYILFLPFSVFSFSICGCVSVHFARSPCSFVVGLFAVKLSVGVSGVNFGPIIIMFCVLRIAFPSVERPERGSTFRATTSGTERMDGEGKKNNGDKIENTQINCLEDALSGEYRYFPT